MCIQNDHLPSIFMELMDGTLQEVSKRKRAESSNIDEFICRVIHDVRTIRFNIFYIILYFVGYLGFAVFGTVRISSSRC